MMSLVAACLPGIPVVASVVEAVPGVFFGLPLLALASFVFAATHHEEPEEIRFATIHWTVWLGGILGIVLAAVLLLGWVV